MVAPLAIMAIGAGVSALSGLIAFLVKNGKEQEADEIMRRAQADYDNIDLPMIEELAAEVLGPTALASIKTDPAYKQAQMEALDTFQEMQDNGGFTLEDQSTLNKIQNQTARNNRSRQNSIINDMRARGVGGSGAEFALRQQAAQDSANQNAEQSLNVAAMAQRRMYEATMGRANLAGNMDDREYGRQAAAAQAQDAIDRFNLGNRYQVAQGNNAIRQQNYNNRQGQADRRYRVAQDQAGMARREGDRTADVISGVGGAVGNGVSWYGAQANKTQAQKPASGPWAGGYQAPEDEDDETNPWRNF